MTTNEPFASVDYETVQTICSLLGVPAERVMRIEINPAGIRVTTNRHKDGKIYLGFENELAKAVYDIEIVHPKRVTA